MSKQKIAILMGGPSSEHDVSMSTGASMLENIDTEKYEVAKVVISRTYQWQFGDEASTDTVSAMKRLQDGYIVLLALHGTFGEDGTVQALLEKHNIPYTGSAVGASLLAMDKTISGELCKANDVLVPETLSFERGDESIAEKIKKNIQLPIVIKPSRQGSSVGVHIVKAIEDIQPALDDAFSFDRIVIVQQYIKGREVACGVIVGWQAGSIKAFPPTELIPKTAEFFDYEAKYTPNMTDEITPPDMPPETIKIIQDLAIKTHQTLGCSSYSRTDMIVSEDGKVYVIELNNLPGMTKTSLLPQQAAVAGIAFNELIDIIIDNARTAV